ncbi:Uncharacterized protein TCM_021827 [Theobroma cacao]|uniref:Uncharacterized protein n=1 Tax=Theobroma cacao TaxID=3641 RepID=A0A061EQP3_THECC|nr:Uncharacterized protein TCM_021827 [Theobroma cacao]
MPPGAITVYVGPGSKSRPVTATSTLVDNNNSPTPRSFSFPKSLARVSISYRIDKVLKPYENFFLVMKRNGPHGKRGQGGAEGDKQEFQVEKGRRGQGGSCVDSCHCGSPHGLHVSNPEPHGVSSS